MRVGSICNRNLVSVSRNASVVTAAQLMRDRHVGALVVTDTSGRRALGMVTDRDLVVTVIAQDAEDVSRLEVGDVMSVDLVTAYEDENFEEVLSRMRENGVRRVPVVDNDGILVGLLALDDLLQFVGEDALDDLAELVAREQEIERELRS